MLKFCAHLRVGVFALLLSACASTPQTQVLLAGSAHTLPRHAELENIPFIAQEDYQCGPAALAMTLSATGIDVKPQELTPQVYVPSRHGSLQVEMLVTARRHGAIAYQLAPRLEYALTEVANGNPVIVLQNLALNWYPVWHYAVVVGYDLDRAEILLRSGRDRQLALPMTTFEHTWRRSDFWAMVALPPNRTPATADEAVFLRAISAFEKNGLPEHAQTAYFAALQRWPHSLSAQIGAGNAAYRLHELARAETVFRQAVQDHPDAVAALNNLAQTLADQGRYDEALAFARRAVAPGGTLANIARETLAEIEGKLKPPKQ